MGPYRHLLVPTDGSAIAAKAVEAAIAFAKGYGAKITFLTALPPYRGHYDAEGRFDSAVTVDEHERLTRKRAEQVLGAPVQAALAAGLECETLCLQNERAWQAILDAAELCKCDLIVMSSHGRRALDALMHGSVTHDVLARSRIPALVYR